MFTGIVSAQGKIRQRTERGSGLTLKIEAASIAKELRIGDSVAVNGCCLTAVAVDPTTFTLELVPETLARTALASIQQNDLVNLELALRPTDRMGGHFVQGHVDGVGTVRDKRLIDDGSTWLTITLPEDLHRYLVTKGSVAVDGVSLTVAALDDCGFAVAMIPHTAEVTNLGRKAIGDPVHIEVDLLAKYVERLANSGAGISVGK